MGEYQDFPSKIFSLTVPKSFVSEPFSVTLFSGNEKFNASENYVTMFRQKFFSHRAEKCRRETLQCFINFG